MADRNVTVLAASLFVLALGEELWQAYLPAYLTALGASGVVVGMFASARDLLDSAYQYPGGHLSDRLGRRRTLLGFTALAASGYAAYALAPSWPFMFAGLVGVMAWKAGAFPTTFAVIGDCLPSHRRAFGFAVQSTLTRIPRVIAAPLGGLLIASFGMLAGVRLAFAVTLSLAIGVIAVQYAAFRHDESKPPRTHASGARAVLTQMPSSLRQLLAADCLLRIGEGIAGSFVVLFVLHNELATTTQYGVLYAVQQSVAIGSYLPGGRFSDVLGRRPLVVLTFFFFAAFPLAVRLATSQLGLIAAFVIGGLKEVGEPARKSLILDLAPAGARGATVGGYYAIRNFLVFPAGLIGGWLWQRAPHLPLEVGFCVSCLALFAFLRVKDT